MYKMRLINLLVFFFAYYGNTFARAAMPLDLDNYDPELVKLKVQNFDTYNLENFFSSVGGGFSDVAESGVPLWAPNLGSDDHVESAHVYTVQSLPQLVFLYLVPSRKFVYFRKVNNKYEEVGKTFFERLKERLVSGHLLANKQYALNLKNTNNNRQFYTRKTDSVDGVSTLTFTPNSLEFKLTGVFDGLLPVYTPDHNQLVTSVTASLKHGEPVAVAVAMVSQGHNVTSFFKKVNNTWEEVSGDVYKRLLTTLAPEDVFDVLTLDLAEPAEEKFQVVKEFEPGVLRTHYTPMPNFHVSKVVNAGVPLWASHDYNATKVHTYTAHNVLQLVKVTTKSPQGVEEDVNLERVPGGFAPLNDQAFSLRVKNLLQEGKNSRGELPPDDEEQKPQEELPPPEEGEKPQEELPPGEGPSELPNEQVPEQPAHEPVNVPVTVNLDVLAPNYQYFVEKHGTYRGAPVKMFFAKSHVEVPQVKVGDQEVWHTERNSKFVSSYLYYLDKQPKVVEVRVLDKEGERVFDRLELEDGVWSVLMPHYFELFLKKAVTPPEPGHALDFDFNKPLTEHVNEENSERFGVSSTSYHVHDGYHFSKVHYGEQLLWSAEHHPNSVVVKATEYLDKSSNEDGQVALVELDGFSNGEFQTYYYSFENNKWTTMEKIPFDKKFVELRRLQLPTTPEPSEAESEAEQEQEEEEEEPTPPGDQFVATPLDTSNFDQELVSELKGRGLEGYYFSSYTPKKNNMFSDVRGPEDFHFESRAGKFVTFVKFFYVHGKLLGARLDTVTSKELTHPLTYYYTYKNKEWSYTVSDTNLVAALTHELAFTTEQKEALENAMKADEQFKKTMERVEEAKRKQAEKEKKKKAKEEAKVPKKLSKKTKLYEDMVDFDQQMAPKKPEPVEETEEEKEARRQDYASERLLVESELVYFELNHPGLNRYVHLKNYKTFGLKALDVTPVVGKWVHVVAMHGKRVWVSSSNKRCTNLQVFYEDDQVVGAVLRVTTAKNGRMKTGDEFDYLFLLEGELKKVSDRDFVTLANRRFQRSTLANLTRPY